MRRRIVVPLLCAIACAPPSASPSIDPTSEGARAAVGPRIVVLVRHGEKIDESDDAALAEAGHARARCLAQVLHDTAITHVLATERRRTRDTVAPLADRLGRDIEVLPAADREAWARRLRSLPPDAIAIAAGHGNTIPDIVHALTGDRIEIGHGEYDRMFVIALSESGGGSMLSLRYCAASAVAGA